MKKTAKRLFSLFIIICFCNNIFAAVVSDNDGSAFITKAEFDSLKNTFQTQIDNYTTTIDSKLDDAISSYLNGVKVGSEITKEFKYKSWGKVTQMNYQPAVTWQIPSLVLSMSMTESLGSSPGTGWSENSYADASIKYERPSANKQVVLMCDAGAELTTNNGPTYVTWIGRSINYKDKIFSTLTGNNTSGYYSGVAGSSVRVYYWARLGYSGYYSDLNSSADSIWNPNFYYWHSSNSSYRQTMSTNWTSKSASTEVTLEKDSNGNEYDYAHIITWGSLSGWRLCDKSWTKHLCANPSKNTSSYPSSNSNGLSISGSYGVMEAGTAWSGSTQSVSGDISFYKGSATNSYSRTTPTVGLLNNGYDVTNIYQINEKFTEMIDKAQMSSDSNPILPDGFPMFAAKKGDKITWTPVFTNSTKGTSTSLNDNIALYLSVGPFGSTSNLKNSSSQRIKDSNNSEYFVIENNSKKITFEVPADGIVYAKWRHEPIYSGNWEISLDLDSCGTYKRQKGVQ